MYKHSERPGKSFVNIFTYSFFTLSNIFQTKMVRTVYHDINTKHRSPSKPEKTVEKTVKKEKHKNTKALVGN